MEKSPRERKGFSNEKSRNLEILMKKMKESEKVLRRQVLHAKALTCLL